MGVLLWCALVLSGVASTLVPTARGYARPTFRNCDKDVSLGLGAKKALASAV